MVFMALRELMGATAWHYLGEPLFPTLTILLKSFLGQHLQDLSSILSLTANNVCSLSLPPSLLPPLSFDVQAFLPFSAPKVFIVALRCK